MVVSGLSGAGQVMGPIRSFGLIGEGTPMATVTLTARYLDQLKSRGKRYEVFDAIVPGLAVRVSASGRKTFTLR